MGTSLVVIIVLSCALGSVLTGIFIYCSRNRIKNGCGKLFRGKRKIHQITVPARLSGENEIVLAVTQRRETGSHNGSSVVGPQTTNLNYDVPESISNSNYNYQLPRPPPHHLVTRHHSFVTQPNRRPTYFATGGDLPSPLVSLSSLQSLLMSSQVAIFNSSTERLSLSSQNQNQLPFQPISSLQQQQSQLPGIGSGGISPFSILPSVSSSCGHLPQPSYFDEPPPSYQASMLIRKLRASDRISGGRLMNQQQHRNNFNVDLNSPSDVRMLDSRRSCRM